MNYVDYLKSHDNFDKYVLFLLALKFKPEEVGAMTGLTRQTVYNILERNKNWQSELTDAVNKIGSKE